MFIVYTMQNCPDCKNAKELLTQKEERFEERQAGKDFTKEDLLDLLGPVRSLPQIVLVDDFGHWHVGGFKDLRNYFSDAGTDVRKLEFKGQQVI